MLEWDTITDHLSGFRITLMVTLASQLILYLSARNVAWGPQPAIAATTAVAGAAQVLLVGYLLRKAKESDGKVPSSDDATMADGDRPVSQT